MRRHFKAVVKPHLYLDVIGRNLLFGETISLEEQQANHKSVLDARRFGWLTELNNNQKTRDDNVRDADRAKRALEKFSPSQPSKAEAPVKSQYVQVVLEKQAEMIKGMLSSYEALKAGKTEPSFDVQAVLRDQTAVLVEIKNLLAQSKPDVQVIQVLNEIKENLKNQPASFAYNREKPTEKGGFKIQEFDGKYVAQVEDLDVKGSKIVTETHNVAGTDDALAALKALKKK